MRASYGIAPSIAMMDFTPPIAAHVPLRKHADPPGLWLAVVGGSVLLNSAIAVLLHYYFHQIETAAIAPSPIAITLITAGKGKATTSLTPAAALSPAPSASSPRSTAPAAATASPPNLTLAKPANSLTPRPAVSPPPPAPFEARPADPEPAPPNSEPPTSESVTSEPMGDRPSLRDTPASTVLDSSPPPPVTELDDQVVTSGTLLPSFEAPPDPKVQSVQSGATTPPAIALNRPIQPLEVVLQVTLGDRRQLPAQQFKTFVSGDAGCIVTPEALHSFNHPLELTLTLDTQGTITETVPVNPTDAVEHPSYTALAQCFLKTLTFPPGESSSPASLTPRVTVILQKR